MSGQTSQFEVNMNNIWQLQEAKSRFSEMVDRAISNGIQIVTRRGKKVVAVISYEEYEQLTRRSEPLSRFFLKSPLAGSELDLSRDKSQLRDIELES
jgi:antitoxin Phd